jgi:hypothetical protein
VNTKRCIKNDCGKFVIVHIETLKENVRASQILRVVRARTLSLAKFFLVLVYNRKKMCNKMLYDYKPCAADWEFNG